MKRSFGLFEHELLVAAKFMRYGIEHATLRVYQGRLEAILYYVLRLKYTIISCIQEAKRLVQWSLGVLKAVIIYHML